MSKLAECSDKTCPAFAHIDKRMTPAERKKLAETWYSRGWTQERIAKAIGVTQNTISLDLQGLSIIDKPHRPKGGRPKGSKRPAPKTDKAREAVRQAVEENKPVTRSLCKKDGIGGSTIQNAKAYQEGCADGFEEAASVAYVETTKSAKEKLEIAMRVAQRKLVAEFEGRVQEEVQKRIASALPHLKQKLDYAEKIAASYSPRFSKPDCRAVERCLHPDTWESERVSPEIKERLKTAFLIFQKMQNFLCADSDLRRGGANGSSSRSAHP